MNNLTKALIKTIEAKPTKDKRIVVECSFKYITEKKNGKLAIEYVAQTMKERYNNDLEKFLLQTLLSDK